MFQNDAGAVLRSLMYILWYTGESYVLHDCVVTLLIFRDGQSVALCFQALITTSDVMFGRGRRGLSVSALHLNPSHGL